MSRRQDRYSLVAIVLHWTMALGIVALVAIGLAMVHGGLEPGLMFSLYQLHKSIGITVLAAAVLRVLWRVTHRPPQWPGGMPAIERRAATGAHSALYAMLFAMPLSGWALVSVSVLGIPTVLYGVIPWPDLPVLSTLADKGPVEDVLKQVHAWGAYALIALVCVHGLAALRHQFILRDGVMRRMLPAWHRRSGS